MPSKSLKRAIKSEADSSSKKKKLQNGRQAKRKNYNVDESYIMPPLTNIGSEEEGEIGLIESITLRNFMCHSNLEFLLGPHVNFIIGRNGSGKSAVLTGIILALGGKSQITGRGTNLRSFIQTGRQTSDVAITLRNRGPDAYRPNDYGPRIIVERKMTSDGTSSYKLKSDQGKLVSTKKEELCNVLDSLNIQIDNPVSVLTQETSRNFLQNKDPKHKYSLFFKATQLEKLWEQYNEAEEKRKDSESNLQTKLETLPEIEKEVKKWENMYRHYVKLNQKTSKVSELENEFVWAVVKQKEENEEQKLQLKQKATKEASNLKKNLDEFEEKYSNCLDGIKQTENQCNQIQRQIAELNSELGKMNYNLNQEKMVLKDIQGKVTRYELAIHRINDEIRNLQQSIEELQMRSQNDFNEEKKKREKEIEFRKTKIADLEKYDIENEVKILQTTLKEIEDQLQHTKHKILNMNHAKASKVQELTSIQKSRLDQELRYGQWIPVLRRKIKECTQQGLFRREPKGPIGLFLKLRDPKWTHAVEECLKHGLLSSFCCDNSEDRKLLIKIMKGVYVNGRVPSIITSSFLSQVHDVRPNKVVCPGYSSVFDMIVCDDPVIINCLVDQVSIENILLIEKSSDAVNIMMDAPPRNCSTAYTIEGDQIYPDPKYRYYSCKKKPNRCSLLQTYTDEDIRVRNNEISSLKDDIKIANSEQMSIESKLQKKKCKLDELNKKQSEKRISINFYKQEIADLEQVADLPDVTAQQEDLDNQRQKKENFEKEMIQLKNDFEEKQSQYDSHNAEYNSKTAGLRQETSELDDLLKLLCTLSENKEKHDGVRKHYETQHKDAVTKVEAAEAALIKTGNEIREFTENAIKVCENRVETNRKPQEIESRINELKKAINESNKTCTLEEAMKNFTEKRQKFDLIKKEIVSLKKCNQILKERILARLKNFERIRRSISLRVTSLFTVHLNTRQYSGNLKFDHDKSTLEINANPIPGSEKKQQNTKGLSGGERSYVTICLLLALWDATEMPFHILDEYDVFMDSLNKNTSLKIMLEKANSQRKNQFIFLSPLDLPRIPDKTLVQIHKMPDPERSGKKACLDENSN